MIDAGQPQRRRGDRSAGSLGRVERLADRFVERAQGPLFADGLHIRRPGGAAPENATAIGLFGQQRDGMAAAAVDAKNQVGVCRHSSRDHRENRTFLATDEHG